MSCEKKKDDLIFPKLKPDSLTEKSYWDQRHRRIPQKRIYPDSRFRFLDFELDRMFKRHLAGLTGEKIIEVGCGSSIWLPYFKKEFGLDITGIDYSETGIETCADILKKNGVKGRLLQADIFEWVNEAPHRFPVLFSLGFIEHFKRPSQVLTTFHFCLSTSGLIMTWVPNTSGLVSKLSICLNKELKSNHCMLDLEQLEHEHRSAGFMIEESRYTQFLDFSMLSLLKLPKFWQRCLSRGFQLFTLPFIFLAEKLNLHISSGFLSSGIVVVARKAGKRRFPADSGRFRCQ